MTMPADAKGQMETMRLSKEAMELAQKFDADPEIREMVTDLLNYREATRKPI